MVLLRKTALHEKSHIQMAVSNIIFILLTAHDGAFLHWKTPTTLLNYSCSCTTGVIAGVAQLALFEGMRQAPVSGSGAVRIYLARLGLPARLSHLGRRSAQQNVFTWRGLILGAGLIIVISERVSRAGTPTLEAPPSAD